MLVKKYLAIKFLIALCGVISLDAYSKTNSYPNEKAIKFTNGEQTVDAYKGTIKVLENRLNPNSRFIPLRYVRFPSTGSKPGTPIIYLSGGPGGSGISTASYPNFRFPLFMALREFGDVIALDQRGTGESKIIPKCTAKQRIPLSKRLGKNQINNIYSLAVEECLDFWIKEGADPLGYTSVQSAADIDDLRRHLNAEKVILWGISYGSHLALTSLKTMGGKIEKVVIASAEGLDQTVKLPIRTDLYFNRLQQAINQQQDAKKEYPDIIAMMHRVHNRLDKTPILLKVPQGEDKQIDFLFQKFHMQLIASRMISDPHRGISSLLQIYKGLDSGIVDFLPSMVKRMGLNNEQIQFDLMSLAMDIASGISSERAMQVAEQAKTSLLGDLLNFPMPHLNKSIEGLDLDDGFREFPTSKVPTLLLTGTLDGRTYIESQKEATKGLSNLTHVIVKNAGHNLFMSSPQITQAILSFLRNEEVLVSEIEVDLPSFIKR